MSDAVSKRNAVMGGAIYSVALRCGARRHIVAAAANRDLKAEVSRKLDGADNVGHAAGAGNQCRAFVHQPVVNLPSIVIADIGGLKQLARERAGKLFCSDSNRQTGTRGNSPFARACI